MPYSSGTFSLVSGNPVTTATTISSSWANNTLSDIATGLSTCLLKDGSQTVTANIPMSNFRFTGLGAGTANGHSLRYEQLFSTSAVTLLGEIRYTVSATVSAAGTNQATATQLTSTVNRITTVSAGTGVLLFASPAAGSWMVIYNAGANGLTVYPQTSGTINQLSANTGHLLPINTACMYFATSATAWVAIRSY